MKKYEWKKYALYDIRWKELREQKNNEILYFNGLKAQYSILFSMSQKF